MIKLNKKHWLFITIIFSVFLVIHTMSFLVTRPWCSIVDLGGDSLKNIYVYLYHSAWGKGYWFDGMNYPYGEHIVFSDGFPLLSVFFATFHHVTPQVALTFMWWLIGLSYVLEIIYLYLILIHFEVKPLLAMLFAGLIGIFSPQLLRLLGHFSLSLSCIVPMLFYWTLRYHTTPKLKYPVYIFILGCIFEFIHPYWSAMVLIWCLFYALGYLLLVKGIFLKKIKFIAPILISGVAAVLFFTIVMKITDPIKDRPIQPSGTLEYVTTLGQILTSNQSSFWQYLADEKIIVNNTQFGEGFAYIGITTLLIVVISFFIGLYQLVRRRRSRLLIQPTRFSAIWLFMAFGTLLFSMGIPFIWHMSWLLQYMSAIRQFRSLGRFSWIFYYIISIYSIVVLNSWLIKLKMNPKNCVGCILVFVCLNIWCYEVSDYTRFTKRIADISRYYYEQVFSVYNPTWQAWLGERHYKKDDFQALLLLSMVHGGTDKYSVGENLWIMQLGYIAALQLHLPIVDVYSARASWGQARKQLKTVAGPFVDKPLLHDTHSDKPFLLLKMENETLKYDEQYLLKASDYIGNFFSCSAYIFYPNRLKAMDKNYKDSINKILPFMQGSDTCIGGNSNVYIQHFDKKKDREYFFGGGAITNPGKQDSNIAAISVMPKGDSQLFEYSNWFLLDENTYLCPTVELSFMDSTNKKISTFEIATKKSVDNNGLWSRGSEYFYMPKNCRKVICRIEDIEDPTYLVLDELVLRPADVLVISKSSEGRVMVNNHLFNPN